MGQRLMIRRVVFGAGLRDQPYIATNPPDQDSPTKLPSQPPNQPSKQSNRPSANVAKVKKAAPKKAGKPAAEMGA